MKITILSGGSGGDSLIHGLSEIGGPTVEITNLINLYDDGKSTGVCRRVMDCLGPSDLRKVQYSQMDNDNEYIAAFFNDRIDMKHNTINEQCISIISELPITQHTDLFYRCIPIFNLKIQKYYKEHYVSLKDFENYLKDFNIANIIYSTLFFTHGIEKTIEIFKEAFNIRHNVVINSYTNSVLSAKCKNTDNIFYEGDIVELNGKYEIESIHFDIKPKFNEKVRHAIIDTDLIIISSGTPYSSIYPTIMDETVSYFISHSHAKKYIIGNNDYDCDSYDLDLDGIMKLYSKSIITDQFKLFVNEDADMGFIDTTLSFDQKISEKFGKDTHSPFKLSKCIYKTFFDLPFKYGGLKWVFDFDDTLFDPNLKDISQQNLEMIQELDQCGYFIEIVSGNSIEHLRFADKYNNLHMIPIWANAANDHYISVDYIGSISNKQFINQNIVELSEFAIDNKCYFENRNNKCFTIKCLHGNRSHILRKLQLFSKIEIPNVSLRLNGKTSLDIIIDNPDKHMIYSKQEFDNMVYVGDSINGNDKEMLKHATYSIISNVNFTNVLLRTILSGETS